MAYQSTLSQDCWARPGFANCMTPQFVIASSYCEKQGTLTDECVGQMADELGRGACNCNPTPTTAQQVTGTAVMPSWVWVVGGLAVAYFVFGQMGKGSKS